MIKKIIYYKHIITYKVTICKVKKSNKKIKKSNKKILIFFKICVKINLEIKMNFISKDAYNNIESLPLTDMWYINGRVESLPLTNMRYISGWVESISSSLFR